jgi:hypothetical protein
MKDTLRDKVMVAAIRELCKEAGYTIITIYYRPIHWYKDSMMVESPGYNITVRPCIRTYPTHRDRKYKTKLRIPLLDRIPKKLGLKVYSQRMALHPTASHATDEVTLTYKDVPHSMKAQL